MVGGRSVVRPSTTIQGRTAEEAAAAFLVSDGFQVLARNLRLGPLEIDIVARRGDLVVLVEVRHRSADGRVGPFESVGFKKRKTLLAAAERYARQELPKLEGVARLRIDVAAVEFTAAGPIVRVAPGALTG